MKTLKITMIAMGLVALMLTFASNAIADTVTWTDDSAVSTGPTRGFKSPEVKRDNLMIVGTGAAASLVLGDAGSAYWKFDEGSGLEALDDTGNGYKATLFPGGAAGPTWVAGEAGHASTFLRFDRAASNYVDCGDIAELNSASAFTIEAWIKMADSTTTNYIITKELEVSKTNITLDCSSGMIYSEVSNGTWAYGGCANPVPAGTWFHAAVVYNGSGPTNADKLKIYVNGNKMTLTFNGTIPPTTANLSGNKLYIGANRSPVFFSGDVDDVRIYKRAISEAQIRTDAGL